METVFDFVKEQRDDYRTRTVQIAEGYEFSQYETLRTIELYHNSRFLSGNKDTLDREKPFFNICKFRVNVATRATDLDTKDVQIQSERITDKSYVETFLLNLKNRNWMKSSGFARFLNRMGATRAKYGGVLIKKTEHDDKLELHVVPWLNVITDQVDIRNGVKIERHYHSPADLQTLAPKNWTNIEKAIETAKTSRAAHAADPTGMENKTPGDYIEVYEVHGVLPTCYLRGTSDKYGEEYGSENEYQRQMHVVVLDETTVKDKSNVKGVTLFAGLEDDDPYKYLPYEEVDGRGLGVGVIEDLFEAQVWTNDGVKHKKDMLELAGKIIFQTADKNIAARNVLTDVETGSILEHAPDKPVTQLNNFPASLPAFDKLIDDWNTQAERVSSTFNAITGESMPSGTPFRQVAILNQEAGSLFEYRREEAGLFVHEIYFDWLLPYLVQQIKKDKELVATLEPDELELVSDALAKKEVNDFAKEQILSGAIPDPIDLQGIDAAARESSMRQSRRAFVGFQDLFSDWAGTVDVITTGEQKNKAVVLETLFNVFKTVATAPQLLQDPVMARLFNQIVEIAGISPVLLQGHKPAMPTPVAPAAPEALPETVAS
ncbi:MAG: hypothetical protein KF889_01620 [Alphaproteobacteria bacterium]|nr:hypothetical protein [Alphaproteobacteria bacterium]MCW5741605.1 hypothetical protein [Alphaproteobacteria bacterium]